MKQITAVGSTDSCWTTRTAASQDGLPQEGQKEGWFRREITKGGSGLGGKPLRRAEAEVQVVDKRDCEAGSDHQAGL